MAQAKRVGQFCASNDILPELILTSPLARAQQTVEHFATVLSRVVPIKVVDFLAAGMQPEQALTALKAYDTVPRVMLVGHEPDFSLLAARLLALPTNEVLHLRKGSLTCFEVRAFKSGAARLEFSIPC